MTEIVVLFIVFGLAILYSAVGHGGASGYLALMAIFSFAPEIMRPTALIMNVFVSSIAFVSFYRKGFFKIKLLIPFIVMSVPFSFLGGHISINPKAYKIILGIFLLIAVLKMIFKTRANRINNNEISVPLALLIGAVLGFFSGLIGIGGGIILSPVILLLGWADAKETSAVSAAFILVNSISGLAGQISNGIAFSPQLWQLVGIAVLGGFIGSYLGSVKLSDKTIRYALSMVLLFASVKLIML